MKSKFELNVSCRILAILLAMAWCVPVFAADKKAPEGKSVDSGSFGVYQGGRRVGTETFAIYETSDGSIIKSEFKTENTPPDDQTSEMLLAANGDIRRYEWKEISPDQAQSEIIPNDEFLNQKWRASPQEKEHEQPYLMQISSTILDDYFFIHREVLAWKFLGTSCKQNKGLVECPVKQRAQFATLNPHEHSSAALAMEFLGREKLNLKNGQQDLIKLELKTEAATWHLWLDDQFKVLRMVVVGENTEVDRD